MPRSGAHFSTAELVKVLSHYELGVIHKVKALSAGSGRAAKVVIVSERGKFLLKRRPKGKNNLSQVAFAHAVQNHLAKSAFPVTTLVRTRADGNTILHLDHHIYELFEFVSGVRYDGSAEATSETGRQLANLHRHLADFDYQKAMSGSKLQGSFHDSTAVRRHLKTIGANKSARPKEKLQEVAEALFRLYHDSSIYVNKLGFNSWQQQAVHGDWHPGNMLFSKSKLVAVLDFDSVKIAPPVTDLANGMLQFSIVGGRPDPADWPDYFDQHKLIQFLDGYRAVIELEKDKLNALICLMIETMIAEAVLPVAATGFFGKLSGLGFLRMIRRKAEWLNKNRTKLTPAMADKPQRIKG